MSKNSENEVIRIDVDAILRQRLPRYYRFIPRGIIRWVERTICQEQLNEMLRVNHGRRDADFCRGVLDHLNIRVNYENVGNLPPVENRRVVFVSNHPLGGLDGMALIDFISRRYGGNIKFVVNDLLTAVTPLKGVFLPINKHGKQSRKSFDDLEEAFRGDNPIIIFPAGLVSRRGKNGVVADLEWKKMFVNKCYQHHRDIIPLHFCGLNSSFFYKFAKFRTRLGLKFNIEMIYLPREVFRNANAEFTVTCGKPISWQELTSGTRAQECADSIKATVYSLCRQNNC